MAFRPRFDSVSRQRRFVLVVATVVAVAVVLTIHWRARTAMVDPFLSPHMLFGAFALVGGPAAMITRKGSWWHRRWGALYLLGMGVSVGTAIPLALHMQSPFFLYLCAFCLYLPFAGYRALARRPKSEPGGRRWWDFAATLVMLGLGLHFMRHAGEVGGEPTVARMFALVIVVWTTADLAVLCRPSRHPHFWLVEHIGKMLGSYVTAVTAFVVVQFPGIPFVWRYVLPSALGAPLIVAWIAYRLHRLRRARSGVRRLRAEPMASHGRMSRWIPSLSVSR